MTIAEDVSDNIIDHKTDSSLQKRTMGPGPKPGPGPGHSHHSHGTGEEYDALSWAKHIECHDFKERVVL